MIELAGGRSITAAEPVSYVRFSIEAAVARAPEVIVLADHSTGASTAGRAAPEKWQALTSVPAIRAGRLYSVDLSVLHRYGPRVPEGLELLARMLGLSSGSVAALGAAVFAFAGALLAATIVYLVATAPGGLAVQTLLLTGVIVGIFFSAAITVIISVVDFNRLTGVIHWLLGNLGPIPAASLALFAVLAGAGVWLILKSARELNLLALGEEASRQLGVDAERLKRRVFVAAALLTGTVVAFTGPIGFVGLIVPHVLRRLVGQDNRFLVPTAALAGGPFRSRSSSSC